MHHIKLQIPTVLGLNLEWQYFQNDQFIKPLIVRAADAFLGDGFAIYGEKEYGALMMRNAIAMKIDEKNDMAFPLMRCNKYCYR